MRHICPDCLHPLDVMEPVCVGFRLCAWCAERRATDPDAAYDAAVVEEGERALALAAWDRLAVEIEEATP